MRLVKTLEEFAEEAQLNLEGHLMDNPCRGIVAGVGENGQGMQIEWIMGRSDLSRNRLQVVEEDGDSGYELLRVKIAQRTGTEDPALVKLVEYAAMRTEGGVYVVSNGDQTDTVLDKIEVNEAFLSSTLPLQFFDGLGERHCEPDAPIFTPRITGCQLGKKPNMVLLSVLTADHFMRLKWLAAQGELHKSGMTRQAFETNEAYLNAIDEKAGLDRNAFPTIYREYMQIVQQGFGCCVTTYMPGAEDLLSFRGEPLYVPLRGTLEDVMKMFWDSLRTIYKGSDCRVAISGREFSKDGKVRFAQPINLYGRVE